MEEAMRLKMFLLILCLLAEIGLFSWSLVSGQAEKSVVPGTIKWPYAGHPDDNFVISQEVHGQNYGHLAIDIAAGHGYPILAVSDGLITGGGIDLITGAALLDQWGNTYAELSAGNIYFQFLHGDFIVRVGQTVRQGEIIGYESNRGITYDENRNECKGRVDCGYHTHWAAFDAVTGAPIYPGNLALGTQPVTEKSEVGVILTKLHMNRVIRFGLVIALVLFMLQALLMLKKQTPAPGNW